MQTLFDGKQIRHIGLLDISGHKCSISHVWLNMMNLVDSMTLACIALDLTYFLIRLIVASSTLAMRDPGDKLWLAPQRKRGSFWTQAVISLILLGETAYKKSMCKERTLGKRNALNSTLEEERSRRKGQRELDG